MSQDMGRSARAVDQDLKPLYVFNGGFLTQGQIRRILTLAGYNISLGKPGPDDLVGIWGQSPTAHRGEAAAAFTEAQLVRVEDAFLRSVLPGRDGAPPLGLLIDHDGVHFDPTGPSALEKLLVEHPLDDHALLSRARTAMQQLQELHLSKYNAFDAATPVPEAGYVLVIDQTKGDASVTASGADSNTFREMLYYAQEDFPNRRIVIKTHPETVAGHRTGYFKQSDCGDRISLNADPVSPYALMEGAVAVYTVSSQIGFEAILMGHKPVVFGQPFYVGWGLSDDRKPLDRRQRRLTKAQLFAAAMILYPTWYDPFHDRLCTLEDVIAALAAQARAWREDQAGWEAHGIALWKRKPLQAAFGAYNPVVFPRRAYPPKAGRRAMVWASKADAAGPKDAVRVEDGFLRSRGLGADLVPALSLVCDDVGPYYDPSKPSRLESLIAASMSLPDHARARADRLIHKIVTAGLSKYNVGQTPLPDDLPKGRRILVVGQVEDDASVLLGAGEITTNLALLKAARAANPAAVILYKPHPDVEAGLRQGEVPEPLSYADTVLSDVDAIAAIDAVDAVWTMTSLLGFEALLRGKMVTCTGTPFYAGWGLTDDRGPPCLRRATTPDLTALVHATLIDYPRYFDPKTGLPCPVEVVVDRLQTGDIPTPTRLNRGLAKLQGALASYAYLWRR